MFNQGDKVMKTMSARWLFTLITVCAATAFVVTGSYAADENNSGQTMYPGMGPGMMGYGGMGPGYRHPEGMGPGYMGRGHRGYGYGMGYGGMMGHGMMGGGMGMMYGLDLDKSQRSKVRALMREQRGANCKVMTEMMDVRDQIAAEYDKDKPDAKAIGKLYEKMQGMQRQMLERSIQMRNKMRGILNKEQKEKFDQYYHGGMGMMGHGMMGYGGMMGPGMMWGSPE
jgi:Spy/CpxP family protein refolding chaperone